MCVFVQIDVCKMCPLPLYASSRGNFRHKKRHYQQFYNRNIKAFAFLNCWGPFIHMSMWFILYAVCETVSHIQCFANLFYQSPLAVCESFKFTAPLETSSHHWKKSLHLIIEYNRCCGKPGQRHIKWVTINCWPIFLYNFSKAVKPCQCFNVLLE